MGSAEFIHRVPARASAVKESLSSGPVCHEEQRVCEVPQNKTQAAVLIPLGRESYTNNPSTRELKPESDWQSSAALGMAFQATNSFSIANPNMKAVPTAIDPPYEPLNAEDKAKRKLGLSLTERSSVIAEPPVTIPPATSHQPVSESRSSEPELLLHREVAVRSLAGLQKGGQACRGPGFTAVVSLGKSWKGDRSKRRGRKLR